jgi:threonylcarbamoyladenosine tRNA methylthiotransferase MtaB
LWPPKNCFCFGPRCSIFFAAWRFLLTAHCSRLTIMNFFIFTTGCKANQWDAYVMAKNLKEEGHAATPLEQADLVVVNACALTSKAETDTRRFIERARRLRADAKIVLAGCHGQVFGERPFGADLVLGHNEKFEIARFTDQTGCVVQRTRDFSMEPFEIDGTIKERTRFFFKIQDGCDRFCTYCIVPYTRGKARSRPSSDVLQGMARLKEKGIREVVLTGIDVGSYKDPESGASFKGLLRLLEHMETPARIRLSSVDPGCIDEELGQIIGASRKLTPSIHIPLQSGDDRTLRRMARPYSTEEIRNKVETLTRLVPGIGIGMDVMVGFPGEDDGAFEQTRTFLESLGIFYLHVFPYSDREGTRAYGMGDKVPAVTKRMRVRTLKELDARKREAFYRRHIGKEANLIPESKRYKGVYMRGYTDNYIPVYLPYRKSLENNLITITIERMEGNILIGG